MRSRRDAGRISVTDTAANVTGTVSSTRTEDVAYWYEYGPTTSYGRSTAHFSVPMVTSSGEFAEALLSGLPANTTVHYRICAAALTGWYRGGDMTFTTTTGRDSVTGEGIVYELGPRIGFVIGAAVDASSDPDGGQPVTGDVSISPGSVYFRVPDSGAATCLRVEGIAPRSGSSRTSTSVSPTPHPHRGCSTSRTTARPAIASNSRPCLSRGPTARIPRRVVPTVHRGRQRSAARGHLGRLRRPRSRRP